MIPDRLKSFLLACFLLLSALVVNAQDAAYKQRYDQARQLLEEGNYALASESFKSLTSSQYSNPYVPYANFFYGVSAYYNGYKPLARDIFLQLETKFAEWDNIEEVYLWEAKIAFETSGVFKGMLYTSKINKSESLIALSQSLKAHYFKMASVEELSSLIKTYPDDKLLAESLTHKLNQLPFEQKDIALIDSLINQYSLDKAEFTTEIHPDVFKDNYTIGVMLPLFVDRMSASGVYLQKTLAVHLFEGMQMALEDLNSENINMVVFDTKRNADTTAAILAQQQLKNIDGIIGPLYPGPVAQVNSFCYDNKINFVNPVTHNSDLLSSSPFAFLSRTGAATAGTKMAEYVSSQMSNKTAAIYYGTSTGDSIMAYNYKSRIEEDSFQVIIIREIGRDNPRAIFDELTASKEVVDSVELRRIIRKEGRAPRFLPLTDSLLIQPDSIGHIFVASDNSVMSAETMSAINSRADSTQIVGYGGWYNEANAGLQTMEEMGVWLGLSQTDDLNSAQNSRIRQQYLRKYHDQPSEYFFMGYHSMMFMAKSLLKYGVYFQNGYLEKGNFDKLYQFSGAQDNQAFNVVKLLEGKVKILADEGQREK